MGFINQQSEQIGGGRRSAVLAAALVALLIGGLFAGLNTDGLASPDAMRYAQIARHALQGRGFLDTVMQPHGFSWWREGRVAAREALGSFDPFFAFPAYLAGWFVVFGPSDGTVIAANLFVYAVLVALFFALARRLWGTRPAIVAAALLAGNGKLLTYAAAGLSEPLYLLLAIAAVYLLVRWRERPVALAWIGPPAALMLYTRDLGKLFVGAFFLLAVCFIPRRRLLGMTVLGLSFAVSFYLLGQLAGLVNERAAARLGEVTRGEADPRIAAEINRPAPTWMGRLIDRVGGASFLVFSAPFPGHSLERSLIAVKASRVFAEHPAVFYDKWRANAGVTVRNLAGLFNPLWLAAFACFPLLRRRDLWPLYAWTWLLIALHVAVNLILLSMPRYNVIAVPFCLLLAAPVLVAVTAKLFPRGKAGPLVLLTVAVALGTMPWAFAARSPFGGWPVEAEAAKLANADRPRQEAIGRFVGQATAPGEVVVGDDPWVIGWRGDRPAIWLPMDRGQLDLLRRRATVDWLLLALKNPADEPYWRDWLRDCGASGAAVCDGFRFAAAERYADQTFYLFRTVAAEGASPP